LILERIQAKARIQLLQEHHIPPALELAEQKALLEQTEQVDAETLQYLFPSEDKDTARKALFEKRYSKLLPFIQFLQRTNHSKTKP